MVASIHREPMTLTFLGEPCRVVDETTTRPTEFQLGSLEVTLAVSSMELIQHHLKGDALNATVPFHYRDRVWSMMIVRVDALALEDYRVHLVSTGPPSSG